MAMNFGENEKRENKQKAMARPYGVSLLIAGYDECGPQLYQTDPSGNFLSWNARAIGPGSEGAQSILAESYNAEMGLMDAEVLLLQTLKTVMQEKISKDNVEMCEVRSDGKFLIYDKEYIEGIIKQLKN